LVSASMGRQLFMDVLSRRDASAVENICGEGPWGHHQTGERPRARQEMAGSLLAGAKKAIAANGEHVFTLSLDGHHAYLEQHRIDGVPVLPAAVALEMMAQATRSLWNQWNIVEVRECRLMKGVDVKEPRMLSIAINAPTYGSSEGFDVGASVHSTGA